MKMRYTIFALTLTVLTAGCGVRSISDSSSKTSLRESSPKVKAPKAAKFAKPTAPEAKSTSDFRRKIDRALRSVEGNPRDYDAYMRLGKLYAQLNQFQKSSQAFENASLIRPEKNEPLFALADVSGKAGNHAKAVQIYTELARKHPKNWALKNNLAVAHRKNKSYKTSMRLTREILNNDRSNIYAINNLGLIYYDTSRYQLAELTFLKGKKINAKTAETYNNLGLTYMKLDLTRNAIKEFRQAAKLSSRLVAPRMNLGDLYLKYKNFPLAIKSYSEVLNVDPLHVEANQNIGVAYLATRKVSKARKAFATIIEVDPQNANAAYNLGLLYQNNLQDGRTALKYYEQFLSVKGKRIKRNHEVYANIKQARAMENARKKRELKEKAEAAAKAKAEAEKKLKAKEAKEKAKNAKKAAKTKKKNSKAKAKKKPAKEAKKK